MNLLLIVVLAVFLLFAISGWRKGMVRKLAGIISLLLSAVLVSAILPYITDFLKTGTPVYEFLVTQCESAVGQLLESSVSSGTKESGSGLSRERIKSLMEQYGMDSSQVDGMTDDELLIFAYQYFPEYVNDSGIQEGFSADDLSSLTRIEQTKLIENLPLPEFLQELMLNYNNSEGYGKLQVSDFKGYLVNFLAEILLNILAFLAALLIVHLVVSTGLSMLNLFARLPVLQLLNRVGGVAVGLLQGIFFVWLLFLIISMFSSTVQGQALMEMIQQSDLLRGLYDSNLFATFIARAVSHFM